jgi:cyclophilin family peptidyl-prolyl cis-trans isomerase
MQNIKWIIIPLLFVLFTAQKCTTEKDTLVKISTNYGDMVVKLYDETPLHKANFLKLAQEGFYDSLLFHRVIENFMIQGGDPASKNAAAGTPLGNGGPGYTIPAEILPQFHHKKGALSAARQGDQVNPEKESSGSQFYLVQGKKYSELELGTMPINKLKNERNTATRNFIQLSENEHLMDSIRVLQSVGKGAEVSNYIATFQNQIDSFANIDPTKFAMNPQAILDYTSLGGTPHLDGGYTVFGEVIEGLNVVDSIAKTKGNSMNRPLTDIRFSVTIIQ